MQGKEKEWDRSVSSLERWWIKSKMAGVSDCFGIGSIVACKTCYNKEIEGEVLAFDPQTKMLILSILFKSINLS